MDGLLTDAARLLQSVRDNENTTVLTKRLASYSPEDLQIQLYKDALRKTFWINCYNAFYQILRKKIKLLSPAIFTKRVISIGGQQWSLDDIEHGILRRARYKYSLGYLPQIFVPNKIKLLMVEKLDYRIHFALNCGAVSCPPIAFYFHEDIEEQLDIASQVFLMAETLVDEKKKTSFGK